MKEMDQNCMTASIVALYFNASYVNIVLHKLCKYWTKKDLYIDYIGLSYTEYKQLCTYFKQHKLYLGHYRYKSDLGYHTVFIFKIEKKQQRLIYIVENSYYHLLSNEIKNQISIFSKNNLYFNQKVRKDSIMMTDEITLQVKEEIFNIARVEAQDEQEPTMLQDISCFSWN